MGDSNMLVLKPVAIPQQLAVVSHREGKETLTNWNTVQAESRELAWVLPLPAVPELVQETHPAALRMLQMICAPPVIAGGEPHVCHDIQVDSHLFPPALRGVADVVKAADEGFGFLGDFAKTDIVFFPVSLYLQGKIMGGGERLLPE